MDCRSFFSTFHRNDYTSHADKLSVGLSSEKKACLPVNFKRIYFQAKRVFGPVCLKIGLDRKNKINRESYSL